MTAREVNRALEDSAALLLQRGVVDPAWFATGGVLSLGGDLKSPVIAAHPVGDSYVVKWPVGADTARREATLHREALLLALVREGDFAGEMAGHLPELVRFDEDVPLLITRFIPGESLFSFNLKQWTPSLEASRAVGTVLARLHASAHPFVAGAGAICRGGSPWILDVATDAFDTRLPSRNAQVAALVDAIRAEPRFRASLAALGAGWHGDAIIHGDLKWANIVRGHDGRVHLIDWEDYDVGDPAWDAGSFLHGFLEFWVLALPLDRHADLSEADAASEWDFAGAVAASRGFWDAYGAVAGVASDAFRIRTAAAAGARLVQTAYEHTNATGALNAQTRAMLRVALNLLADPSAGAVLLGLDG